MINYTITIKNLSELLIGSAKGAALIDSDIEFHANGLPFLRAKTLKGLLRESMLEVLEINNNSIIDISDIFGKGEMDLPQNKIRIGNADLSNYAELNPKIKKSDAEIVKAHFTKIIQQTAIDEYEIAKDFSLRSYRVLKSNQEFTAKISVDSQYIVLFKQCLLNLRFGGMRRNRGWGRLLFSLNEKVENTISTNENTMNGATKKIEVKITTLEPIVLGTIAADKNTVSSAQCISGNHLRGIVIEQLLKNGKFEENKKALFSNEIQFNHCQFNNAHVVPNHIHFEKHDANKKPVNVFALQDKVEAEIKNNNTPETKITKPFGGLVLKNSTGELEKQTIQSTMFFHNSRFENRVAGKSGEDDAQGGIFYYDAINANQTFVGSITGNVALLKGNLPTQFTVQIGRSRSAQYGTAEIVLKPCSDEAKKVTEKKFLLYLQSALILKNENGMYACNEQNLINSLATKLSINICKITHAAASFTQIEQLNQQLGAKSGKWKAYNAGSVFAIELDLEKEIPNEFYLGEYNVQGFGLCKIHSINEKFNYEKVKNDKVESVVEVESADEVDAEIDFIKNHKDELKNKTTAINNSVQHESRPNNHQISRLLAALKSNESEESFNAWLKNDTEKLFKDNLKKVRVLKPDYNFNWDLISKGKKDFKIKKMMWIEALNFWRKLNKINKL